MKRTMQNKHFKELSIGFLVYFLLFISGNFMYKFDWSK